MTVLKNLSLIELENFFLSIGEKKFRGSQVMQWLYRYRANHWDDLKNLSAALRQKLEPIADIAKLPILVRKEAKDGSAIKLAVGLPGGDNEIIECVLLNDGKRRTACLSSQLGCKYGCAMCSTALMGYRRNLTQQEILEQLIALQDQIPGERITNVVFMGMGEPLDNLETILRVSEIIQSDFGFLIGGRKITISTCGLVPKIRELADRETNMNLAVSLNAPDNAVRDRLIPINRTFPIEMLLDASEYYFKKTGRRVTFEYVLMDKINSEPEHISKLKGLLTRFPCKLNLIPFHPKPGCDFRPPEGKRIREIIKSLENMPSGVTLRKSLGVEISAACGQLYQELKKIRGGRHEE